MSIEWTDRYQATGTPYPDLATCCPECDGMGILPVGLRELHAYACAAPNGRIVVIGQVDSDGEAMSDGGYVFVQCPVCGGSRVRP